MPTTGLCLLPPGPSGTSISSKLSAHLSRHYPEQEHHPFHLEHRLFSDTASQLPSADAKQRAFTHVLSFSRLPQHAFVTCTKPGDPDTSSSIIIPSHQFDSFTALIQTKLQPAWYPRQMLSIENGVYVHLQLGNNSWAVCIGDAKVAARSQGAGALRGTLIEVFREDDPVAGGEEYSKDAVEEDQLLFQNVLNTIFKGTGETFDHVKLITNRTRSRKEKTEAVEDVPVQPDWNLAKLYMALFRR